MASPSQKYHGVQTPAYTPGRRFLNANANGSRVGYAASNAEHMNRVDEALTNFVNVTQGQLMSPKAPSWRRGERGAKLDHLVTWRNLSHDSSGGSLRACWRSVGSEIPEGCTELEHPALAQRLASTTTLRQHELASLLPQGLDAQRVVRVGEQFLRPVPLGHVEWLGGPQHDHARVGFRIEPQVLTHTRQYGQQTESTTRIRLKDWQKLAPALQRRLGSAAETKLAGVRAGTVDAGEAVRDTLRSRDQLARNWMAPTIRSRERHQRRAAHRSHEQIQLLRTIARVEAAIRDGTQLRCVTRAQNLDGRCMEPAAQPPGKTGHHIHRILEDVPSSQFEIVQRRTGAADSHSQVRENRRAMDRRARRAFEDEHKGPS